VRAAMMAEGLDAGERETGDPSPSIRRVWSSSIAQLDDDKREFALTGRRADPTASRACRRPIDWTSPP